MRLLALLALGALALGGCAGERERALPPGARIPEEAPFLLDPLAGYAPLVSSTVIAELREGHQILVSTGQVERVLAISDSLLRRSPDLAPAMVLAAQARLVEGDLEAVLALLRPLVVKLPGYDAGVLAYGRAAERAGSPVDALIAYGTLADRIGVARNRVSEVKLPAVRILAQRVSEALGRKRLDEAAENLKILQRWAPELPETLRATAVVAAAEEDPVTELDALRGLKAHGQMDRELLLRTAHLELEVGDAGLGLRIFQDLAAAYPDDSRLAAELARAKFLWRLELLPEKISQLIEVAEMTRGELSAMLYWLFPSVRYGHAGTGRIANDILDHPHRQEIVRVANMGILGIDARLHRFEPDRVLPRSAALLAILRTMAIQRPAPACLGDHDVSERMSVAQVCDLAARCGLLEESGECLAEGAASGRAALEWVRLASDQLDRR